MLILFQRALLGLSWICFVSGYYSSDVSAPKFKDVINGVNIANTDLPLKFNISTVSDEPAENNDEFHICDDPETCKNGGKCVEAGRDFTCDCLKEFTGKDCSKTVWCETHGLKVCGKVPCTYNPALNRSYCDCGKAQYFDVKVRECKKIYECLELQLSEKCLSPHETCQKGTCFCEKGYEYTKNNETCVRKNMCTDGNKKKSCSGIAALCEEDLDADNGFKCICDDGYARDVTKNETCTHKCNLESNIEKCSPNLSFCELDSDYNSKCTCPPIYVEESSKSCNKLAEYFFIDAFQILKKPYEVFRDPETLTSLVDYTKLGKDFKEAFSSVFKFYKSSKVFTCKEKSEYLNCTVELQLTKLPGEELNLIFTPSVCLPMINSKYCLIPPRLILRNKQHGVFKKTNICDDIISTSMCGSSTNCELSNSERDFQCTCKQGFIPTGAYLPFPGNSESVIQKCLDIDECLDGGACPQTTYCVNSIGSYDCYCKKGLRQNAEVDIKIEGCVDICNPNPCKHGHCNLTGSDGFTCNCDPSYTGLKCDEPNLLVTDIESSAQKSFFIIGGALGSALLVAVLICLILIWKYRKQALKIEKEGKTYELRRRQWIESKRECLETRNGRETGENHETVSNIYTEQENSIQRQYRQRDSGQDIHTNAQVYHQDYIRRAHAKGNMGISYQRSHSNNDILYTNAVVHRESEESINDSDKDGNQETYVKRMYHDPKETPDTSLDLQISSSSNNEFYYTTMPSGVDVRQASESGRSNTEAENKVWKKHNDAKYYKKYKSRQMFKSSDTFQDNVKFSRVLPASYKDVANTEAKQCKHSFSNDESYENAMVPPNRNNKDYELRSGKDIRKLDSNQQKENENVVMQYNEAYKEDQIML